MKEVLAVPEENLEEVIKVIRAGINTFKGTKFISKETIEELTEWCNEEEEYIKSWDEE